MNRRNFIGSVLLALGVLKANFLQQEQDIAKLPSGPSNVAAGDTITVDGLTYTFKVTPTSEGDIALGSSLNETIANAGLVMRDNPFFGYVDGDVIYIKNQPRVRFVSGDPT